MNIIDAVQGSDEWKAARAQYHTASEAPAMMGASKKVSRNELLRMKATGSEKEFSEWTENVLFARGHEVEALARPIAEEVIGQELYPATATNEDGYLLASFDGVTMLEDVIWECKQWNEAKANTVRDGLTPKDDYWQVVHQLAVSGAEKCLYMVTDGTEDNTVCCWVTPNKDDTAALMAGWKQFDKDLANYEHVEQTAAPVGEAVTQLPSVSAQVSGSLEIVDNLKVFEAALRDFIDNRLITSPQTDQDFADLDSQIKTLEKAESALDGAEATVLSMVSAVDAFKRTKDMLHAMARDNRLMAQKLLKAEKENRRNEILAKGKAALQDHIASVNASLGKIQLPSIAADFAGAMKGKRTITSLNDAVDTELARAKIESNAIADKIRLNVETLRTDAKGYESLFADAQQLALSDNEHLKLVIKDRIREHKEREEARLEAEREKIRAEEKAKAEAEAARVEAQRQREIEEDQAAIDRAELDAAKPAPEPEKPQATKTVEVAPAKPAGSKTYRPTDKEILKTLCDHYQASEANVIDWLKQMDFSERAA
ncbi:YqaJ viral recombinase family protein [Haliea salexigens]|uniref:YqaJ viral recombinase family protein n=1 Tax=Haliea salexigens TaxID=287487 RepID=UPI00040525F0|nr:YqaJ viral recombinase family protein [Haliea salexigens]